MQRVSPEPCRGRHRPAQAGWPHRGARWEALCHAVGGDGATRHGLKSDGIGRLPLAAHWRVIVLFVVLAATGCAVAAAPPTSMADTGSRSAGPTSSPQIRNPAANGSARLSAPSVVGAGSFPRSLLIPGTNTSIRIDGS